MDDLVDYIGLIIGYIPIHSLRLFYYRHVLKVRVGKNTSIHRCCQFRRGNIVIGNNVIIGENALLDGSMGILIEDNVNFSSKVSIYTVQHDYNSPGFDVVGGPVTIKKNCWISSNSTILPNVTVGEGAVVAAMCLVNKDVPEYTMVRGVPFQVVRQRSRDIQYKLQHHKRFH